jgi:hypothetical protein
MTETFQIPAIPIDPEFEAQVDELMVNSYRDEVFQIQPEENPFGKESVSVPTGELIKLEKAREQLYDFLNGKISEQDMLGLVNITGQIWKVANRKNWNAEPEEEPFDFELAEKLAKHHDWMANEHDWIESARKYHLDLAALLRDAIRRLKC